MERVFSGVNSVVCLLLSVALLSDFLTLHVHRYLDVLPELLSIAVLVLVLLRGAARKSFDISPKYVVLAVVVGGHVIAGLVLNQVSPGTFVAGLRNYIKWIPLFLLPAVYQPTEEDLRCQLKVVLSLAMVQWPLTIFQRFIQFRDLPTGDVVRGTFGASGALSVFLMSVIAVSLAFLIRGRIRLPSVGVLIVVLFFPTTINETKVTLVLLPIVATLPLLVGGKGQLTKWGVVNVGALAVVLVVVFVTVYEMWASSVNRESLLELMGNKDAATRYLYRGTDWRDEITRDNPQGIAVLPPQEQIRPFEAGGRIDKILLPLDVLAADPARLWFGTGIGNVSESFIKQFSGQFSRPLGVIANETLFSFLLWEVGIGGLILFIGYWYFLLQDSRYLSKEQSMVGTLAVGWVTVLTIAFVTFSYTNFVLFNGLAYPLAYFSGVVAATRYRRAKFAWEEKIEPLGGGR